MLFNGLMTQGALALTDETVSMLWQVPVLGMLMVFTVLALLWGVLAVFKLIFVGKSRKMQKPATAPNKKQSVTKAQGKADSPAGDELLAVLSAAVAAEQNDAQLVAVLSAAVAAYRAAEGDTDGAFRVVSFKRQSARAWNKK